jgi:hypothetical protein
MFDPEDDNKPVPWALIMLCGAAGFVMGLLASCAALL